MKPLLSIIALLFINFSLVAQVPERSDTAEGNSFLLIVSSDENQPEVDQQISIIKRNEEEFDLKTFKVYHITPERVKSVFDKNKAQSYSFDSYAELITEDSNFNVLFIDKKGVVKHQRQNPVQLEELKKLTRPDENERSEISIGD